MADDSALIDGLIRDIKIKDPRLAQALTFINFKLRDLNLQINPLVLQSQLDEAIARAVGAPASFTFEFTPRTVRLHWSPVTGAVSYEVRLGEDWDTATFQFRTVSLQADVDPLPTGSTTFLLKSLNSAGVESILAVSLIVIVPNIPAVIISAQVIDNNVLLFWNEPASIFVIDFYEVFKAGVSLGFVDGTFLARFEQVGGTYSYSVVAHDIADNESTETTIVVNVNTPPDFALTDTRVSDFSGTFDDIIARPGYGLDWDIPYIVGPFNLVSFENHFILNGWASIQEQIDAGYPLFLQPTDPNGTYIERIDYGLVLNNVIVTLTYNAIQLSLVSDVLVTVETQVSLDDISYSAYVAGSVQFYTTFRYLRFKITFTTSNDHALLQLTNLVIRLDVKREQDGGIVNALATDATGTIVLFNKTFLDIDSIDVSSMGTVFGTAIVDFTDVPNPTSFKVLVFDAAGVRITSNVRWIARGIV